MAATKARGKGRQRGGAGRGRRAGGPGAWVRRGVLAGLLFAAGVVGYSGYTYYHSPEQFSWSEATEFGRDLAEGRLPLGGIDAGAVPTDADVYIATVKRVVDGDTLLVTIAGVDERVRLLCVDTPESVHPDTSRNEPLGEDAAQFTRDALEQRQVRLVVEPGNGHDRFGRRLAYVMHEGENFNLRLVREGYSEYYTEYGRSRDYDGEFRAAEREARAAGRGVWAGERELAGRR